jgi:hypothetical protein
MGSPTIRKIIAIDHGDDGVVKAHAGDLAGNMIRLIIIHDALGVTGLHGAKTTAPRAGVTKDHESSRARIPALGNVRATGLFANGVERVSTQVAFDVVKPIAMDFIHFQPTRLQRDTRGRVKNGLYGQRVEIVKVDLHGRTLRQFWVVAR